METLSIDWSYPSSDNAAKFGFSQTGCWTISLQDGIKLPLALSGHQTKEDATKEASSLNIPIHPLWR